MAKENVCLGFKLNKVDETRNYLLEEIKRNHLRNINYFEHIPIFVLSVSGCVSISVFTSLDGVSIGAASSKVGLKVFAITAGIKNTALDFICFLLIILLYHAFFSFSRWLTYTFTARKMKFSIKDFFSKCNQICR